MKRTVLRYGLLLFAGFAGFFLLMYILGLGDRFNLRFFNIAILLGVLWYALRDWARSHPVSLREYPQGIATGIGVSMVGSVLFAVFMAIFLGLNPTLLHTVQQKLPLGMHITPITVAAFIVMENLAASLLGSYIFVRIFEREQMGTE
jgi:hypothetical protein